MIVYASANWISAKIEYPISKCSKFQLWREGRVDLDILHVNMFLECDHAFREFYLNIGIITKKKKKKC